MTTEKIRLDKYLWAVRLFKTRTLATTAIDEGKVTLQGQKIKPAHKVSVGEVYDIKAEHRKWKIQVTALPDKRSPYQEAIQNYTDLTPAEEISKNRFATFVDYTGKRMSKQGRPTKKDRRSLGNWLGGPYSRQSK